MTVIDFGKQPEAEKSPAEKLLAALGLVAAIVFGGAVGWALLGFFFESISYSVALIIGGGLARVLAIHFRPLNVIKGAVSLFAGMFLSFISIAIGEFLFFVLYAHFDWDFSLGETILIAWANPGEIFGSPDAFLGYIFSMIGAIIGLISAVREKK